GPLLAVRDLLVGRERAREARRERRADGHRHHFLRRIPRQPICVISGPRRSGSKSAPCGAPPSGPAGAGACRPSLRADFGSVSGSRSRGGRGLWSQTTTMFANTDSSAFARSEERRVGTESI